MIGKLLSKKLVDLGLLEDKGPVDDEAIKKKLMRFAKEDLNDNRRDF